jgi:DNA mismatch repair protein MutS
VLEPVEGLVRPSILYPERAISRPGPLTDRRFAVDLNLDQVFAAVNVGHEQLDLLSIFYTPLSDLDDVAYRHEVLADLEHAPMLAAVRTFGRAMQQMREILATARSLRNRWQRERHFVDAVLAYCDAVSALASTLSSLGPRSRGMRAFTEYICAYQSSAEFTALVDEAGNVITALGGLRYTLHIRGTRVTVSNFGGEPNYAQEVEAAFAKFTQDPVTDYTARLRNPVDMNRVEAQVLELVARLNPGPFGAMHKYFEDHQAFVNPAVATFDRDSQFYLAYLYYIEPLRIAGLPFCYPHLSQTPQRTWANDAFDLALATKIAWAGSSTSKIVSNDFELGPAERILVVTGPNNGGKTTFARALGQLHYLASLGLPVPAREADLVLADGVFTSFQQAEQLATGKSHLEDELVHLHGIIERTSPLSVIVMNESFSSTTLRDAALIGRAVLAQIVARGSLCTFVTFVDELATANEATVSMVATVHPDDPVLRTYKVVRKPAEGRAYAAALAERYGLTDRAVRERVTR